LGAIQASSGNLTKALQETLAELPEITERLTPQQQADFFALLKQVLQAKAPVTSSEKRPLRRALTQHLEAQGLENARQLADRLVDLGVTDGIEPYVDLLQCAQSQWVLQLIYNLSRIQGNNRTIHTAVERAAKIVFALKSYARFDQSGTKQPVQITEGIETVLELYHSQLKHGIEVIRHYETIPELWGYPDELVQVWTNLIHNAIQAMNGKGGLKIQAIVENHQAVVKVSDSGCGIAAATQDKIFEPFFTTKPQGEGSGLGLSISQTIVEKHGGQITFDSQSGWTTFTVRIPLTQEGLMVDVPMVDVLTTEVPMTEAPMTEALPPLSFSQDLKSRLKVLH
jgi:signal transduction histidine kinase